MKPCFIPLHLFVVLDLAPDTMQIYRIKNKKGDSCFVTPMMFIEYKKKGREIVQKVESRPYGKDAQEPIIRKYEGSKVKVKQKLI